MRARRTAGAVVSPRRTRWVVASAVTAGTMVPAIECGWLSALPWQVGYFLRGWGLHFFALYAAAVGTLLVLGFFAADSARRRSSLRRLGVWTPMTVSLLHELGQSIWPHDQWELWDTFRDAGLNIAGAALVFWLVREGVVAPPADPGQG